MPTLIFDPERGYLGGQSDDGPLWTPDPLEALCYADEHAARVAAWTDTTLPHPDSLRYHSLHCGGIPPVAFRENVAGITFTTPRFAFGERVYDPHTLADRGVVVGLHLDAFGRGWQCTTAIPFSDYRYTLPEIELITVGQIEAIAREREREQAIDDILHYLATA